MADDPLNKVRVGIDADPHTGMLRPEFVTIVPDERGGYVSAPNNEQITGPEFWQRTGIGIDRYAFRAPTTGEPLCIGSRGEDDRFVSFRRFDPANVARFAGFRRIVDAEPYRGRRLRFTAWVATGRAEQVSFWLAAGTAWRQDAGRSEGTPSRLLVNGGNTNDVPFGGNRGWTPVVLETGPIHADADHVSYGFNLQGSGDVWVYEPKLEIVAEQPGDTRTDELIVTIGRDQA